jgi:hypothetical protein
MAHDLVNEARCQAGAASNKLEKADNHEIDHNLLRSPGAECL